jgi:1,4-alpha-glucan branching enzyme
VDNRDLKYHYLGDFDRDMLSLIKSVKHFEQTPVIKLWDKDDDQILAYMRCNLLFVFNFSPNRSFEGYGFLAPEGKYKIVLNTDSPHYGGNGTVDESVEHFTLPDPLYAGDNKGWLRLYIPARIGMVLRRE